MRSLLHAIPTDVEQFTHYIRYLIRSRPPLPFSKIIDYHNRHPECHSVESHNMLLGLSIRHGRFQTSRSLLDSLSMNHIEPNEATEKLIIRLLVSRGLWDRAWQQALHRYSTIQAIPLSIFLELLVPDSRHTRHTSPKGVERSEAGQEHNAPYPMNHIPRDIHKLVLYRFADFSPDVLSKVSLRVLYYIVRSFLRAGQDSAATRLTEGYIRTLPNKISTRRVQQVQALINMHLSTGEVKYAIFKRRKRLVESLYDLHPQLYPNSNTLFLLMRYLARSKRCGVASYLLYKSYLEKWGPDMDDLQVRGRIIKYAIKQRKLGIAREMSSPPATSLSTSLSVDSTDTDSMELPSWRTVYPGRGRKRSEFMTIVLRRLRESRRAQWQLKRIKESRRRKQARGPEISMFFESYWFSLVDNNHV